MTTTEITANDLKLYSKGNPSDIADDIESSLQYPATLRSEDFNVWRRFGKRLQSLLDGDWFQSSDVAKKFRVEALKQRGPRPDTSCPYLNTWDLAVGHFTVSNEWNSNIRFEVWIGAAQNVAEGLRSLSLGDTETTAGTESVSKPQGDRPKRIEQGTHDEWTKWESTVYAVSNGKELGAKKAWDNFRHQLYDMGVEDFREFDGIHKRMKAKSKKK